MSWCKCLGLIVASEQRSLHWQLIDLACTWASVKWDLSASKIFWIGSNGRRPFFHTDSYEHKEAWTFVCYNAKNSFIWSMCPKCFLGIHWLANRRKIQKRLVIQPEGLLFEGERKASGMLNVFGSQPWYSAFFISSQWEPCALVAFWAVVIVYDLDDFSVWPAHRVQLTCICRNPVNLF